MSMPMDKIISQSSVGVGQLSEPPAAAGGITPEAEQQILTEAGFLWRERDGVKVLVSCDLEDAGFVNGFSTRLGGVSPFASVSPAVAGGAIGTDLNLAGFNEDSAENIYENRRRFLAVFGGDFELMAVWQVHGDLIKTVKSKTEVGDSNDYADAIVSNLTGVLAGVKTADCVPVLIGDPKTGAFAAIHAGWRGTVQSIVGKAVAGMIDTYGTDPKDIIAAIGPAASCSNYEIGDDVITAFAENFAGSEKYFSPTRTSHALVDLHLANRDQLTTAGVPDANITTAPFCTMERPDLFFSYRLEKKKYGKTGRLMSVIGRRG